MNSDQAKGEVVALGGGEMCPRNVTSVSAEKIDGVAGARPQSHRPRLSEKLDYWANLRKTQQAGKCVCVPSPPKRTQARSLFNEMSKHYKIAIVKQ